VVVGGTTPGTWQVDSKECYLQSADNGKTLTFSVSPAAFVLTEISGSCSSGWDQRP
jgi:hypothetical protein